MDEVRAQQGRLEENIGRLVSTACRPAQSNPAFKDWLGAQLERQIAGLPVGHADEEVRSCLDDNLNRVLVAATADVALRLDARQTLRSALRQGQRQREGTH